jgi:hypothetical protein
MMHRRHELLSDHVAHDTLGEPAKRWASPETIEGAQRIGDSTCILHIHVVGQFEFSAAFASRS